MLHALARAVLGVWQGEPRGDMTPREVVESLDRNIVGQTDAKKAVANALRNRWRRRRIESPMKVTLSVPASASMPAASCDRSCCRLPCFLTFWTADIFVLPGAHRRRLFPRSVLHDTCCAAGVFGLLCLVHRLRAASLLRH